MLCYAKSLQSCSTVWPHRRQPTRLRHPWDSLGKNTGVGCHFLLQCMKVKSESEIAQLCLTLSDPMDCSPPGSSVHGIFQARVLEWGAIPFSNWMINLSLIEKLYMTIISLLRQSYKVISHRMSMTEIRHTWALILVYPRHWWEMLHEWRKANKNGGVSRVY